MPQKQRGRPVAENPKSLRVDVRLTAEELKMLDEYCQRKGVTRPQGLRDGIKALKKNERKWCVVGKRTTPLPPYGYHKGAPHKYYTLCGPFLQGVV